MKSIIALIILLFSTTTYSKTCIYNIKKNSQKVTWTSFKYTEKTAVSGTFKKIFFTQSKTANSMSKLLESIEFKIDTKSIDSKNLARDTTLKRSIFKFLKIPNTISGKVVSATQLDMTVEMEINEKTPMQMSLDVKDGRLISIGTLNLLEHGLKKAYNSVHVACKGLHTGKDGVSKIWPTVEIKIEANYDVKCSKGVMDSIKSWFS